jgi:predicted RNA-binding Zn-ribbon protein involved in translation (DUF1610 family)
MKAAVATFTCPCCGFSGLSSNPYRALPPPPWKEEAHGRPPYCRKHGDASYEVCDCCGFEFGNDDEPGTAAPSTFQWFDPKKKKKDWSLADQLTAAGISTDEKRG